MVFNRLYGLVLILIIEGADLFLQYQLMVCVDSLTKTIAVVTITGMSHQRSIDSFLHNSAHPFQ